MKRQRCLEVVVLIFCCIFLLFASNNENNDVIKQIWSQLKSFVLSQLSLSLPLKKDEANIKRGVETSTYKYNPPKNEKDYDWGFSSIVWTCNDSSYPKANFKEIRLTEEKTILWQNLFY